MDESLKKLQARFKEKKWETKRILSSGGMWSSHSASVSPLAMAIIGLQEGADGSAFALAVVLTCVAARETSALKEAKDKLEKRVKELTWRLQLKKHLLVLKRRSKSSRTPTEGMQSQLEEAKGMVIKEREAARKLKSLHSEKIESSLIAELKTFQGQSVLRKHKSNDNDKTSQNTVAATVVN